MISSPPRASAVGPLVSIGTWSTAIWGEGSTLKTRSFNFLKRDADQDELPNVDDDDKDDGENVGAEYYH